MKFVHTVDSGIRTYQKGFYINDSEKLSVEERDSREQEFVRNMVLKFKNDPPVGYTSSNPDISFLPYTGVTYNIIADRGVFLFRMVEYRGNAIYENGRIVEVIGVEEPHGTTYYTYTIILQKSELNTATTLRTTTRRRTPAKNLILSGV